MAPGYKGGDVERKKEKEKEKGKKNLLSAKIRKKPKAAIRIEERYFISIPKT